MDGRVYDNRELSWLKFNERVLEEAEDNSVPLFERLRFVSIFCSNLDEFFMIRVGSLYDQLLVKQSKVDNKTHLTAKEQLTLIAQRTEQLLKIKDFAYKDIISKLAEQKVEQINLNKLSEDDELYLKVYFKREILPLLSPVVVDKKHPFPFLNNQGVYAGVMLKSDDDKKKADEEKKKAVFGIVPASGVFDRIIYVPCEQAGGKYLRFVLAEDLILHYISAVFTNYTVEDKALFRVTRNADIDVNEALYDYDVDFRDVMEELCQKRKKLTPVRLEFCGNHLPLKEFIAKKLELKDEFVFNQKSPLDMSFVFKLEDKIKDLAHLFYTSLTSKPSAMVNPYEPMINQIAKNDIMLFYPYESFSSFTRLLEEAGKDTQVVSIKITLYRVARQSEVVSALIRAAENGKEVLALVELRARFDEENNIGWSKKLEDAGVKVIYGLDELKVHSKLLLITRKVGNSIKYYTQVGTGNYNERTSKLYTDITLMTADQDIGADASVIFNALSVATTVESTNSLLVAPKRLKSRVVEMIDNEMTYGEDGYIGIKMNSLTDKDIIDKLIEANKKGVKVQLIIRGICCLIAGIDGETENISVISIVGRFLEHSRIYIFGKEERQQVYISSADFMTRNTERRVEVGIPLKDKEIKQRVIGIFMAMLKDNVKAREQCSDGIYRRKTDDNPPFNSQEEFYREAYERARLTKYKPKSEKSGIIAWIKGLFGK